MESITGRGRGRMNLYNGIFDIEADDSHVVLSMRIYAMLTKCLNNLYKRKLYKKVSSSVRMSMRSKWPICLVIYSIFIRSKTKRIGITFLKWMCLCDCFWQTGRCQSPKLVYDGFFVVLLSFITIFSEFVLVSYTWLEERKQLENINLLSFTILWAFLTKSVDD